MASQKILTFSTILVLCLLIVPNNVRASHESQDNFNEYCFQQNLEYTRLVARDVIQQTIHNIEDLRDFINHLPRLKSLPRTSETTPEVEECVLGLTGNLTVVSITLSDMRHLDDKTSAYVILNSEKLQSAMSQAMKLQGRVCHFALRDVDRTITSMLSRKLLDLAVVVDDIIYLVYQLQIPLNLPPVKSNP